MSIKVLKKVQVLKCNLTTAWEFFSSPQNLKLITPPYMGFEILNDLEPKMYPGQIIVYSVSPLFNINLKWVTEITHVSQPYYFVDEQRFGPYRFWHHKHFFKEIEKGVEMTDIVHYSLPYGFLGEFFHSLIVRPKLEEIFNYRYRILEEKFNEE